jgi:hypothetical protein
MEIDFSFLHPHMDRRGRRNGLVVFLAQSWRQRIWFFSIAGDRGMGLKAWSSRDWRWGIGPSASGLLPDRGLGGVPATIVAVECLIISGWVIGVGFNRPPYFIKGPLSPGRHVTYKTRTPPFEIVGAQRGAGPLCLHHQAYYSSRGEHTSMSEGGRERNNGRPRP